MISEQDGDITQGGEKQSRYEKSRKAMLKQLGMKAILGKAMMMDTLGYPVLCYEILWVIPSSVTGYFELSRTSLRDTLGSPV
ncbi:hypothetical protein Tco_1190022 [Tanacetum coccineum]